MIDFQVETLIRHALSEDIGSGDVTTQAVIPEETRGSARIIAKEPLVVAGTQVAQRVFLLVDPSLKVRIPQQDGSHARPGDVLLEVSGGVSAMPGPKFVFAHIGSPHEPFVFGPHGEKVPAERQDHFAVEAYRDQVIYLNSRMIPILREIISASATPPVIILQADHGGMETEAHDRMAILNAYYLPDGGNDRLYENISPVNSFRLVFNTYLNGDYELLEDTSYFSKNLFPYKFTVVEETRPECIDE